MQDIIENVAFTAGLDPAQFREDRKTVYAVVRALEIISEASRRLPAELRDRHSELDWAAISAAANLYRHEYEAVDEALIWHTVQHDLATLRGVATVEFDRYAGKRDSALTGGWTSSSLIRVMRGVHGMPGPSSGTAIGFLLRT